jgi:hypothetical protein
MTKFLNPRSLMAVLFASALLLAACGGGAGQQPGGDNGAQEPVAEQPTDTPEPPSLCDHEFFPVEVGATWTYSVTGTGFDSFTYTDSVSAVRDDGFTLTSAFPELTRTQEWACSTEGLAALEYGGGASASLSGSGLDATFETTSASGISLPANLAVGDTWTQAFVLEGDMNIEGGMTASATGDVNYAAEAVSMETINVPAGSFEAIKIQYNTTFNVVAEVAGLSVPVTISGVSNAWYAPGVGLVRIEDNMDFMGSAVTSAIELTSYSVP